MRVVTSVLALGFTLLCGPLWAQFEVGISDATCAIGDTATVDLTLDAGVGDLAGWSIVVCESNDNVLLKDVTVMGAAAVASFSVVNLCDMGWSSGVVVDFLGAVTLPVAPGVLLMTAEYACQADGMTTLSICSDVCNGVLVESAVITAFGATVPLPLTSGIITVGTVMPPDPEFIRGDVDGDGIYTVFVDGLYLLLWGFVAGSPAPPCLDAADADDDGMVSPFLDALVLFNFSFINGPAPAAPFPGCGVDGTADSVDCAIAPCP